MVAYLFLLVILYCCQKGPEKIQLNTKAFSINCPNKNDVSRIKSVTKPPPGMVWIPGGKFLQGAVLGDTLAMPHEKPAHEVKVEGFFMDIHEVTNKQYSKFIKETGYITVAERAVNWEEFKKQLPKNITKPHDSLLKPGSLVFKKPNNNVVSQNDYLQWWEWKIGASWKHPNGPESSILGKENDPVVHIAYEDAIAYCNWAGRRLPTEAEWEYAARAGKNGQIFYWGNSTNELTKYANTWGGSFPEGNNLKDGYELRSPVGSFTENGFGLYDMLGNVWEWTTDWYDPYHYDSFRKKGEKRNSLVEKVSRNPNSMRKVIKGGSFLCSANYCASYRISARMATSMDSGLEHLGFRTVKD